MVVSDIHLVAHLPVYMYIGIIRNIFMHNSLTINQPKLELLFLCYVNFSYCVCAFSENLFDERIYFLNNSLDQSPLHCLQILSKNADGFVRVQIQI